MWRWCTCISNAMLSIDGLISRKRYHLTVKWPNNHGQSAYKYPICLLSNHSFDICSILTVPPLQGSIVVQPLGPSTILDIVGTACYSTECVALCRIWHRIQLLFPRSRWTYWKPQTFVVSISASVSITLTSEASFIALLVCPYLHWFQRQFVSSREAKERGQRSTEALPEPESDSPHRQFPRKPNILSNLWVARMSVGALGGIILASATGAVYFVWLTFIYWN